MKPRPRASHTLPRYMQEHLRTALCEMPVVLLQGARQCGKSTLARMLGEPMGYVYHSFDDANLLRHATDDPVGFINSLPSKVILDEVQHVPHLFRSIKLKVDTQRHVMGQFLLTGSSNVLRLPGLTDSLAGRMRLLNLQPLSQYEIVQSKFNLLDCLFENKVPFVGQNVAPFYPAREIVQGGYPELLNYSFKRQRAWYNDYIDLLSLHDAPSISNLRSFTALPKLLTLLASQTAQLLNITRVALGLGVSRAMAQKYLDLLEQVFLVVPVAAWSNHQFTRLVKAPKLHISDTGVACALLNISCEDLHKPSPIKGHLLESFVLQELMRQASYHPQKHCFYHYRDKKGVEIDIIIERSDGRMIGVEVKSAATLHQHDFKALRQLKQKHPKLVGGLVVYTGSSCLSSKLDDAPAAASSNIYSLPVQFLCRAPSL